MQRKNTSHRGRGGQRSRTSSSPDLLKAALGIAGGIGVGAAVMYLLDPNQGERRRQQLAQKASDAAHGAWDTVSEHAADTGGMLAGALPIAREKLMRHMDQAGDKADEARRAATGWMEFARSRLSRGVAAMNPFERPSVAPAAVAATAVAVTSAGLAALAIGATAMYFCDPDRGRARRAWIGQKLRRGFNETGRFMRATGRHLANKGQGYYHQSRSAAEGAMDSAMSKFGRHQDSATQEPAVPNI
jgi:gas vesicle protein